ncbi:MAG: hypothetical protein ACJA2S_000400 [Cyclobacteriaceae bacterium]
MSELGGFHKKIPGSLGLGLNYSTIQITMFSFGYIKIIADFETVKSNSGEVRNITGELYYFINKKNQPTIM